ncbi:uncharacterized protein UMAG_10155 [Mycosarcoma maydis]|uniref:Galactose oxidase n=1 Tax=Mycosarcoma maydis TaxID=5270 RepID=A0A0D1E6B6_MYCMD|nr:uncharacterized protein UMAG_10155 [Ustilago maydis 521]KIS69920.1 hypothetical protein UMAG_10155 [Ustilago maydis 521]|eukprot:XP_011388836.1 hypothetical protein UMAG_10155 [Ustilago maydis 521]
MLRSLLVLVLLVPYVSGLPSGVSAARRSTSVESRAALEVSEPSHSHGQKGAQYESWSDVRASTQPRYLDRSGSSSPTIAYGKQRQRFGSQTVVGKSRVRRDDVFPAVAAADSSTTIAQDGGQRTLTIVFEHANGTEADITVAAPPTKRWGQTATYVRGHNVVLVVGGQTSISGDITNDVYALDVSDLSAASMVSNSSAQSWQRLSSNGLPAHAYAAASVVTDPVDGSDKLWIVGGVTENCAHDAPAYVWSAPAGNITAGKWAPVYADNGVAPSRRRGAKAVTLTSSNATPSVLVSGGTYDASTCASTNGTYAGLDVWGQSTFLHTSLASHNLSKSIETAHVGVDVTGTTYATIQSLAIDARMRDFSLTDYATVVLPANGTCGEKVVFLGGKDGSGNMARLDKFWVLDVGSGNWEHWNATGLIPSGRMGHTAVVSPDGKIIVHGGYLQDPWQIKTNNDPIDEVFILDPRQTPARWDAATWTSESSKPPSVAYHSAVMTDEVMVVSFGRANDGPAFASQSFSSNGVGAADAQLHYMDVGTMQTGGGMTWSASPAGVAQARQAIASAAADIAAPPVSPVSAASSAAVTSSTPTTAAVASSSVEPSQVAAPTLSKVLSEAKPTSQAPQDNQPSTGSKHTGAIAGSLLGAAAIAAAIGGIYAYRKRKEAAAYNLGRQEAREDSTLDRFHRGGEDEEKNTPYVSNLYLGEMRDVAAGAGVGAAAAAAGGWGGRLKRAASRLSKTVPADDDASQDRYTSRAGVTTLRNTAARAAKKPKVDDEQALPDEFITSLVAADEEIEFDASFSRSAMDLSTGEQGKDMMLHSNVSRASVNSFGASSAAGASHLSYPYLAGMHRGASPKSLPSPIDNASHRVRVILGTPRSISHIHLSPGDTVSPYHLPQNPHTTPESLCLDFETDIALDGNSTFIPASPLSPNVARTPLFPWSTPTISSPAPVKLNPTNLSLLRSKPTALHVTNDY